MVKFILSSEQIATHATCKFSDMSELASFPILENSDEKETIAYMDVVVIRNDQLKGYYVVITISVMINDNDKC